MLRYKGVFFVLLLVGLVVLFVLLQAGTPEAEFRYVIAGTIKTLDPAGMSWNEDIRIALGMWEGLASYHPETTEPVEGVAYLPPLISDDGLTYTFELRDDARWSNGDSVNAGDFVYAWRRAIEPGTAADYAFLIIDNIAGAKGYSNWRNEAVRVLSLLRDLDRGRDLTDSERDFIESLKLAGADGGGVDWAEVADGYRQKHLSEMEERFGLVGIKALSDKKLEVKLVRPLAYFLDLVAFTTFLPIHRDSVDKLRITDDSSVTDLTLWVYDPQWVKPDYHRKGYPGVVSNGAFALSQWRFKNYMLMEKNPYYWDKGQVGVDSIMVRIISDAGAAFLAYERGELDWMRDLTRLDFAPALVEQMRNGNRDDIHFGLAFGTYFYNFNCQSHLFDGRVNPFFDRRVRMAFSLAVDRVALVEQVKQIGNPPAYHFVPPGTIEGYGCSAGPGIDVEKARSLLAEAGYAEAKGLGAIEILYNTDSGHEKIAEAVAQMWKKNLNVEVVLKGKEVKTFDDDRKNQRFMVARSSWYGDYNDPTTFLDMMVTGNGQNDSKFSNAGYDLLMSRAADCKDEDERLHILSLAETMLIQREVPLLTLYHYVNLMAFRDEVTGIYGNAREMHPFKYIRVERRGVGE